MNEKKKTILSGLVIFSVVLNILLIGIIVGHMAHRFPGKKRAELSGILGDKGKVFNRKMNDFRSRHHKRIRQLREELVKILGAKEFDARAYQEKAKDLQHSMGEMFTYRAQLVKELALQSTQEERKKLIEFLESKKHRRRHGKNLPGKKPLFKPDKHD